MPTATSVTLKDIRRRLGATQRAFGQKLGVTARTVTRWELEQSPMPHDALPRALLLLRAKDAAAADRIALDLGLPAAAAQEDARRAALDHAVFAAADALDVSPRRARVVLAAFVTHLAAAGLSSSDARARLVARIAADAAGEVKEG